MFGSRPVPRAGAGGRGGGEAGRPSICAGGHRGRIPAFDGWFAGSLQSAGEAAPPLPRKSLRDTINVSHIVLIVANKCLNDLM